MMNRESLIFCGASLVLTLAVSAVGFHFAALPGDKRLLLVPGAGHNDALSAEAWREIEDWVERVLPRETP